MEGDVAVGIRRNAGNSISIHALRVEGDTENLQFDELIKIISIHALRVEGDLFDMLLVY